MASGVKTEERLAGVIWQMLCHAGAPQSWSRVPVPLVLVWFAWAQVEVTLLTAVSMFWMWGMCEIHRWVLTYRLHLERSGLWFQFIGSETKRRLIATLRCYYFWMLFIFLYDIVLLFWVWFHQQALGLDSIVFVYRTSSRFIEAWFHQ